MQGVVLQQNVLVDAGIAPVLIQHIRIANQLPQDVAAEVFMFGVALLIGGNTHAGHATVTALLAHADTVCLSFSAALAHVTDEYRFQREDVDIARQHTTLPTLLPQLRLLELMCSYTEPELKSVLLLIGDAENVMQSLANYFNELAVSPFQSIAHDVVQLTATLAATCQGPSPANQLFLVAAGVVQSCMTLLSRDDCNDPQLHAGLYSLLLALTEGGAAVSECSNALDFDLLESKLRRSFHAHRFQQQQNGLMRGISGRLQSGNVPVDAVVCESNFLPVLIFKITFTEVVYLS